VVVLKFTTDPLCFAERSTSAKLAVDVIDGACARLTVVTAADVATGISVTLGVVAPVIDTTFGGAAPETAASNSDIRLTVAVTAIGYSFIL